MRAEGLLRLAEAWHSRVMADEIVSHAFSHVSILSTASGSLPTGLRPSALADTEVMRFVDNYCRA